MAEEIRKITEQRW